MRGTSLSNGHRSRGRTCNGNERTQGQAYAITEACAENAVVDDTIFNSHP